MNLIEAKQVFKDAQQSLKDLPEAMSTLLLAIEGLKPVEFDTLRKKKEHFEMLASQAQQKALDASTAAEAKIAEKKAEIATKLVEFGRMLNAAEQNLADERTAANVSRETMQQQIAQEKMELTQAKQAQLKRLDEQIAQRQKTLDEMNKVIEESRRRFAQ